MLEAGTEVWFTNDIVGKVDGVPYGILALKGDFARIEKVIDTTIGAYHVYTDRGMVLWVTEKDIEVVS